MTATFQRRILFRPGYNYLHETGPQRRGQHGMEITFVLIGPHGAAQFVLNTGWTPLGQVDEGRQRRSFGGSSVRHADPGADDMFPTGVDLGYHWTTPLYDGQEEYRRTDCHLLPGGICYYDGSGLTADDVLRDFITEGQRAAWRWLIKRYRWCLADQAERGAA